MKTSSTVLKIAAGTTLVATGAFAPLAALASDQTPAGSSATGSAAEEQLAENPTTARSLVRAEQVQGDFSYSQDEATPNETIARTLYKASRILCGAGIDSATVTAENASDWVITVSGDVESEFSATIGELTEQGAARTMLGCTCTSNPAGGLASANANVTGVTIESILERSGVSETANTISFVSDDGYTVSLPLGYVTQRYSMIVYEVNDEALCDVAGSANQVWLGSTSARYFAQNVSDIVLSTEREADIPPIPGTPDAKDVYANRPNVSVREGTTL